MKSIAAICLLLATFAVQAAEYIKPFVLAASESGELEQVLVQTRDRLR